MWNGVAMAPSLVVQPGQGSRTIPSREAMQCMRAIPDPSAAFATHGVCAYQKVPEPIGNIHALFEHSISQLPSLEALYNQLALRSTYGNRHYRTIRSIRYTWNMGLPECPRAICEHSYSVAIFVFIIAISGGNGTVNDCFLARLDIVIPAPSAAFATHHDGPPKSPKAEHTCSVATFIFTTTIT